MEPGCLVLHRSLGNVQDDGRGSGGDLIGQGLAARVGRVVHQPNRQQTSMPTRFPTVVVASGVSDEAVHLRSWEVDCWFRGGSGARLNARERS